MAVRLINAQSNDVFLMTEMNLVIPSSHQDQLCRWNIALDNAVDYRGTLSELYYELLWKLGPFVAMDL